jgi:hypothetical protein
MSTTDSLLATIEPDEVAPANNPPSSEQRSGTQRAPVVLTPTSRTQQNTASSSDLEAGESSSIQFLEKVLIFEQV